MPAPTPADSVKRLLRYWRTSLADEDILGTDQGGNDVKPGDITADGEVSTVLVTELRQQWSAVLDAVAKNRTSSDFDRKLEPDIVPVVLLRRALAPAVEHGAAIGGRVIEVKFTQLVPATLTGDGRLLPDAGNPPWIGKEFLSPLDVDQDDLPIIGAVEDFDRWLERNPVMSDSWPELIAWCDEMWSAVTRHAVPNSYVLTNRERVSVSGIRRGMGQHILKLYDALLERPNAPQLLGRLCLGGSASELSRADRIEQMRAPRGCMGPGYGLAMSQADAAGAASRLAEGGCLAVNGPPGTGKTTLLQSIIAAAVVERAIAGAHPAIIFGCSTTNQAVTNINRAMNSALAEDRSGDFVPWARRWVPNAESYGLYLPSDSEQTVKEAEREGFQIAIRRGNAGWQYFPERTEGNNGYVVQAATAWKEAFAQTYGREVAGMQEALDHLRSDLRALWARAGEAAEIIKRWAAIEDWWRKRCADGEPEQFLDAQAARAEAAAVKANATLAAKQDDLDMMREFHDCLVSETREEHEATVVRNREVTARLAEAIGLDARLAAAGAPQSILEHLAGVFSFLRHTALLRQRARRIAALQPDEHVIFLNEMADKNPQMWERRTAQMLNELREQSGLAQAMCDRAAERLRELEARRTSALDECSQAVERARDALKKLHATNAREREMARKNLDKLLAARREATAVYDALRVQRPTGSYADTHTKEARTDWLAVLDRTLDVTLRHEMFHKAMRYWEGRWIIEVERIAGDQEQLRKNGHDAALARLRRWCMLTPCLVATLHSLPSRMRFSGVPRQESGKLAFPNNFLLEAIDLLIIDEAGQVGPHVGMASFALAKRAIVVGDVHQLAPVMKIPEGMDRANARNCGLRDEWAEGGPVSPHILSKSAHGLYGSLMRVAQRATAFTLPGAGSERGIFLSEHRRCDPSIIGYCNTAFYQERLQALTEPRPKAPEMRAWGWGHVRGQCERSGSSRVNIKEAHAIAEWIAKRAQGENGWLAFYRRRDPKRYAGIGNVVAVLTPFAAQAKQIKRALKEKGGDLAGITVGTVNTLQGAERPIVIFSPTYSDAPDLPRTLLFENTPNILNVAVSRAMDSFVVIGDMRVFRKSRRSCAVSSLFSTFYKEENELLDVEGNYGFSPKMLREAKRLSSLDEHRALLASAFDAVASGETLVIVSPFITRYAVESDRVAERCRAVAARGGGVHIVIDQDGVERARPGTHAAETVADLRAAGAVVHLIGNVHSKTLTVANRQIAEGSFNWLSALRNPNNRYFNYEASYVVSGEHAEADIRKAIGELNKRGASIPS